MFLLFRECSPVRQDDVLSWMAMWFIFIIFFLYLSSGLTACTSAWVCKNPFSLKCESHPSGAGTSIIPNSLRFHHESSIGVIVKMNPGRKSVWQTLHGSKFALFSYYPKAPSPSLSTLRRVHSGLSAGASQEEEGDSNTLLFFLNLINPASEHPKLIHSFSNSSFF